MWPNTTASELRILDECRTLIGEIAKTHGNASMSSANLSQFCLDFDRFSSAICVFLVVLFASSVIVRSWMWSPEVQSRRRRGLPPGSLGLPVFGEMLQFIYQSTTSEFFQRRISSYGSIFKTHILFKPTIFIAGPDPVRKVLTGEHHLVENCWPSPMRRLLGPGALATADGAAHKARRQTILRCFRRDFFEGSLPRLVEIIEAELGGWGASNSSPVEVYRCAKRMAIRAAAEVLLGVRGDDLEEVNENIVDYANGFFAFPVNLPGTTYNRAIRAKSKLHEIIASSLRTGSDDSATGSSDSTTESSDSSTGSHFRPTNLIGRILADEKRPRDQSMDHVIDQALELLFGGQETISAFVTCLVLLLSKNGHVIEKLSRELSDNRLLSGADGHISMTSLAALTYVDYVTKEVLRMYPPIGGGYRKVIKEFDLQGFRIPVDWAITYSIKATHDLSPLFIADRDEFRPERWSSLPLSSLPGSSSVRLCDHFLPFGAGARACVGQRYARLFMRLFTVLLVRKMSGWTLTVPDPVLLSVPIIRPKDGLFVRFQVRSKEDDVCDDR